MNILSPKESTALVRKEIKAAFPGIKFSITTDTGIFYKSANVRWVGGPSYEEVREVVRKFETTKLDPYTDYREAVPGTIGCLDSVSLTRRAQEVSI